MAVCTLRLWGVRCSVRDTFVKDFKIIFRNEGGLFILAQDVDCRTETQIVMNSVQDLMAVIEAVSRISEIPAEKIFSKQRGQEYYDARWLAIQLLSDMGYYSSRISNLTGMTQRNVNLILTSIKQKKNSTWKMFGRNLEECRKVLGIGQEIAK